MTYVIGEPCVDVLDRACVEECPVDCIYGGEPLPSRSEPIGSRGGAAKLGAAGADIPFVAALLPREQQGQSSHAARPGGPRPLHFYYFS